MSGRQSAFAETGYKPMPLNLTAEDLETMRLWMPVKAQCPWCLYTSNLWSFATFNYRKKKGKIVNEQKCRCPDCGAEIMRRTLLKIHEMTMGEYGLWFWDAVFTGGSYEKVCWDKLKARLRSHFTYAEAQPFWTQYWAHKELSLSRRRRAEEGMGYEDDEEDFIDYLATSGSMRGEGSEEDGSR